MAHECQDLEVPNAGPGEISSRSFDAWMHLRYLGAASEDIRNFSPGRDILSGGMRSMMEKVANGTKITATAWRHLQKCYEQGPFEAAFGFSQSAAFLTAYISQLEREGAEVLTSSFFAEESPQQIIPFASRKN